MSLENQFINVSNLDTETFTESQFDHICQILRPSDLLNLTFYFFNVRLINEDHLIKKVPDRDSFMTVRVPQQHRGEEVLDVTPSDPIKPSKVFTSGFSYLTFKIVSKDTSNAAKLLVYDDDTLLAWNDIEQYQLIDTPFVANYPKYNIAKLEKFYSDINSSYPFTISANPYDHPFLFKSDTGVRIPVTLFEVPYKMYLSPIMPQTGEGTLFTFSHDNEEVPLLELKNEEDGSLVEIFEIWNNNLGYKKDIFQNSISPPSFKILGFANADREPTNEAETDISDHAVPLLPDPNQNHREHLALLSRLGYKVQGDVVTRDYRRDIKSDYFNISGLGVSTYLKYDHPDPKENNADGTQNNYSIVGWKQDIKLGCDNYVEIVTRAVDANSGLKILVVEISERQIKNNISFLKKRLEYRYLETEKSYDSERFRHKTPFKHIKALEDGSFFSYKDLGNESFAVCREKDSSEQGIYPEELLKFKYIVTDWNNVSHEVEMDVLYIPEGRFETQPGALDSTISQVTNSKVTHKNYHALQFQQKFAFANSYTLENIGDEVSKNVEFESKEVLLYPKIYSYNSFDDPYSLVPLLLCLKAPIPQLNGLESTPSMHFLTYAKTYKASGFQNNVSNVFLKRLSNDFLDNFNLGENQVIDDDFFIKKETPYDNFMAKDHANFGPIGNTNSSCEGIFLNDQALVLTENINSSAELVDINTDLTSVTFQPTDFLGVDVELLGGIKIKDILEDALGLSDLPITKVYEDIKKEANLIESLLKDYEDIFEEYRDNFEKKIAFVKAFPARLRLLEKELVRYAQDQTLLIANRWIEKMVDYYYTKVVLDFAKNKEIQSFTHNLSKYQSLYTSLHGKAVKIKAVFDAGFAQLESDVINLSSITPENLKERLKEYKEAKKRTEVFFQKLANEILLFQSELTNLEKNSSQTGPVSVGYVIVQHYLYKLAEKENVNLKRVIEVLKDLKKRTKTQKIVDTLIQITNDVYKYTPQQLSDLKNELAQELKVRTDEVQNQLSESVVQEVLDKVKPYLLFYEVVSTYKNKCRSFEGRFKEIIALSKELEFSLLNADQTDIEYVKYLKDKLPTLTKEIITELKTVLQEIKTQILPETIVIDDNPFKVAYEEILAINPEDAQALKKLEKIALKLKSDVNKRRAFFEEAIDKERSKILKQINDLKSTVEQYKEAIKDAPKRVLELLKVQLEQAIGDENIAKYEKIKKLIKAIETATEKTITYTWNTTQFKNYSSGMVRFIKRSNPPTSFSVDFKATTYFDISLETPPKITNYDYSLVNRFSNFGIGLGPVLINFEELRYENGSSKSTDFSVKIRDVQFEGPLNFIKAFQDYLQTLNKNLILRIDESGATLGYSVPLPNLLFGYINFFQLKLSMAVTLPFLPKRPTLVKIGINNPSDRFIITVNGYMGTGYFETVLDPKVGLISIAFVVEFEANFRLSLPGAKGYAHLLAGFYFRKIYDIVELRGNLHLSGGFNIINLFHSSVTFDMTLIGNGDYLRGSTNVKVSHRFSRWFKVSVRLHYSQKFYGTKRNNASNNFFSPLFIMKANKNAAVLLENGLEIIDSNFYYEHNNHFINLENQPWLIFRVPKNGVYTIKTSWKKRNGNRKIYTDKIISYNNTTSLYRDDRFNYVRVELIKRRNKELFDLMVDHEGKRDIISTNNGYKLQQNPSEHILPNGIPVDTMFDHYLSYL